MLEKEREREKPSVYNPQSGRGRNVLSTPHPQSILGPAYWFPPLRKLWVFTQPGNEVRERQVVLGLRIWLASFFYNFPGLLGSRFEKTQTGASRLDGA